MTADLLCSDMTADLLCSAMTADLLCSAIAAEQSVPRRLPGAVKVDGAGPRGQSGRANATMTCDHHTVRRPERRWALWAPVKIVLAGGSGSLGRRLASAATARGDDVVVLTRTQRQNLPYRQVLWDGKAVGAWADELDDAVLINLAGELVDRRPSASNIALLTRSRVEPTRALAAAARQADRPPQLWLQLSTTAIYGDTGDVVLDEDSPVGTYPPQMCAVATAWEAAASGMRCGRQVILRTSVVLDRDTPALDRLTTIAKFGLGGRIGNGQQWVSWLHINDFLTITDRVVADPALSGIVHATSPQPVRNADLMRELRAAVHRPPALPMPRWLVKVGAVALRTDPALALTGRRATPAKLRAVGYRFEHPDLSQALASLLARE